MSTGEMGLGRWGVVVLAVSWGCGGPPPAPAAAPPPPPATDSAPAAPPPAEPVDTGKDCATGQGRCGGGACNITIKNGCDQAIRCELEISATCESQSGTAEAGGRERQGFAPGTSGDLGAQATCTDGRVVRTEIRRLSCK